MNIRRYMLFLTVALLTFVIGVKAAIIFGGFTPLGRSRSYSRCGHRRQAIMSLRGSGSHIIYPVYRSDGTVLRAAEIFSDEDDRKAATEGTFSFEPPPPPPPKVAPRR